MNGKAWHLFSAPAWFKFLTPELFSSLSSSHERKRSCMITFFIWKWNCLKKHETQLYFTCHPDSRFTNHTLPPAGLSGKHSNSESHAQDNRNWRLSLLSLQGIFELKNIDVNSRLADFTWAKVLINLQHSQRHRHEESPLQHKSVILSHKFLIIMIKDLELFGKNVLLSKKILL